MPNMIIKQLSLEREMVLMTRDLAKDKVTKATETINQDCKNVMLWTFALFLGHPEFHAK